MTRRRASRVRRVLCIMGLGLVLAAVVIGPALRYGAPTVVADEPYAPVSPAHPLGTDHYGFDVLARVLDGGWRIVAVSLIVVAAAYAIGLTTGMLAAVRGGWFDTLALRAVDVLMSLPSLILLTVVVAGVGRGMPGVAVAATVVLIPDLVRIIRAATAEILGHDYVEPALARGERTAAVLWREILPNLRHVLIADVAVRWIAAVFTVSTASFLGLGVQPPSPDWGLMVYENQDGLTLQPLAAAVPAVLLLVLLLSASTLLEDFAARDLANTVPATSRPRWFAGARMRKRAYVGGAQRYSSAERRGSLPPAPDAVRRNAHDDVIAEVHALRVTAADGTAVLDGVDVAVRAGEVVALVGESGSGKTTTALAMLGHVRPGLQLTAGHCWLGATDLIGLPSRRLRRLRGEHAAYVAQDPRTALAGHIRLGDQVSEALRARGIPRRQRPGLVAAVLASVGLPADRRFQRRWPHEVSGGQRQRVALAAALVDQALVDQPPGDKAPGDEARARRPRLLVLDEPTSALDLITADRLLSDIDRLRREYRLAVLFVSHDLGAVRRLADRVVVLSQGRVSAAGPVSETLPSPAGPSPAGEEPLAPEVDPATPETRPAGAGRPTAVVTARGRAVARAAAPGDGSWAADVPLLLVRDLDVARPAPTGRVLSGIDLAVARGGSLSVLGESGCGKTTLVRCLAGMLAPEAGTTEFAGQALPPTVARRSAGQRRRIAYVPQNPYDSLNPRHTVEGIVGRPLRQFRLADREGARTRCGELLDLVGLDRELLGRRPGALSGGQRQRVALARALAGSPDLLLCDEVTSALDAVTGAAIVDLLARMRDRLGLGLVVVTHDPAVAARLGGEVLVLHGGRTVEAGPAAEVLTRPTQPYTATLLAAAAR